jgi:RimJ/RimL family protein N-acetyltransferase
MSVSVQPISIEHSRTFREALDAVARERRYLMLVEAPPLAEVEKFVRRTVARDVAQFVAVDSEQNRVVGWCDIFPREEAGFTHAGRLGMGVVAAYRGKGIGRRLLEATLKKAQAAGLTRIELEVFASNHTAIALYEKFGFSPEGRSTRARYLDGVWDDLISMSLLTGTETR